MSLFVYFLDQLMRGDWIWTIEGVAYCTVAFLISLPFKHWYVRLFLFVFIAAVGLWFGHEYLTDPVIHDIRAWWVKPLAPHWWEVPLN